MARERRPGSGGRMLFTDFDPSDKERDASLLEAAFRPPKDDAADDVLRPAIPTLEELAAAIGIDFEDDSGDAAAPATPRFSSSASAPGGRSPRPLRKSVRHVPPGEPSRWREEREEAAASDFADDADNRAAAPARFPEASVGRKKMRPAEPFRDDAAVDILGGMDADEEEDILSGLPADDSQSFAQEWRGRRLGMPPPRSIPYGGLDRLNDWFRPPEGATEEFFGDDAAALDQTSASGEEEDDGANSGSRLGVPPPRATPYGGLERMADWFRPPEGSAAAREPLLEESAAILDAPLPGTPTGEGARKQHAGDTTQGLDMFKGLDLEGLWREKVAHGGETSESHAGADVSVRTVDVFSDVDLESVWQEKQEATGGATDTNKPPRPADTVIMSGRDLNAASTVIMQPFASLTEDPPGSPPRQEKKPSFRLDMATNGDAAAPADVPAADAPKQQGAGAVNEQDEEDYLPGEISGERVPDIDALFDAMQEGESGAAAPKAAASRVAAPDIGALFDAMQEGEEGSAAPEAAAPPAATPDIGALFDAITDGEKEPAASDDVAPPVAAPDAGEASGGAPAGEPNGEAEASGEGAAAAEEPVAVNPMDVFSNLDAMDFSGDDGLDDDMKALLEEDEADAAAESEGGAAALPTPEPVEVMPTDFRGKLRYHVKRKAGFVLRKIAWRENWRFYCNLLASIIASASLAVIISYFLWYR